MTNLLLIPLEDMVVFPNMSVTLPVDVADGERVLLVPVHEGAYADVGTVAEATDVVRLPGGAMAATLAGLHRGVAGAAQTGSDGRLRVEVEERPDEEPPRMQTAELEREYRAVVEEILDLRDADARIHDFVRSITEPGALADTTAYAPDVSFAERSGIAPLVSGWRGSTNTDARGNGSSGSHIRPPVRHPAPAAPRPPRDACHPRRSKVPPGRTFRTRRARPSRTSPF